MKKQGFTLVELLAVIVILGIISLIVFPNINSLVQSSKDNSYNIQIDLIEKAGKKWIGVNSDSLLKKDPYHLNNVNITLTTLKQEGFLENTYIVNPKTKKIMTGCVVATYNGNKGKYDFNYIEDETNQNNLKNSDDKSKKYAAEIKGCDSKKGYIYTYDSDYNKTNGDKNSKGETITPSDIFANELISKASTTSLVDLGDEYFYQGLTPTNYVKIDGYDTVWRILSIDTDEKTIKLIALGDTINAVFGSSTSVFKASSYDTSTDLKTNLEAEINKINVSMIKKESVYDVGSISNINDDKNIIKSEENQQQFKGKIGIITASEYLKTKNSSSNTYLDRKLTVWTMNFTTDGKHVIITADGKLSTASIDTTSRAVYPAIIINANVVKKSGTGTSSDPYIIKSLEEISNS